MLQSRNPNGEVLNDANIPFCFLSHYVFPWFERIYMLRGHLNADSMPYMLQEHVE